MSNFSALLWLGLALTVTRLSGAATHSLSASTMSPGQVVPLATSSRGTGACNATVDDQTGQLSFSGRFASLSGAATSAHLHGPAGLSAGPAPILAPASTLTLAPNGSFSGKATLSPAQVTALLNGLVYCDVHSSVFSAGEVRGQLLGARAAPSGVSTWLLGLILLGVGLLALKRWSRGPFPNRSLSPARTLEREAIILLPLLSLPLGCAANDGGKDGAIDTCENGSQHCQASAQASAKVNQVREQFRFTPAQSPLALIGLHHLDAGRRPFLPAAVPGVKFLRQNAQLRPQFGAGGRAGSPAADVQLPTEADGAFSIRDVVSGLQIAVTLRGSRPGCGPRTDHAAAATFAT